MDWICVNTYQQENLLKMESQKEEKDDLSESISDTKGDHNQG